MEFDHCIIRKIIVNIKNNFKIMNDINKNLVLFAYNLIYSRISKEFSLF